ncbi:MAG: LamG domain-containing protein [Candidatus Eisenbacteria bacterium]|nr:LamG domain-containing protein [Candidatus Eisenbacteria bacterium]
MSRGTLAPIAIALLAASVSSCMHATAGARQSHATTDVDSVTVALWRFDEPSGVRCVDAGPFRFEMTAGGGTQPGYGRFGGAREFTRVIDSFAFAPYSPALDPPQAITIEAWVNASAYGQYEDTPIAAHWTQEGNQQSWLFGIVGQRALAALSALPSPGYHDDLVAGGRTGQLLFAFQPDEASQPRSFRSTQIVPLGRWVHVAVTFDGAVVRFYFDGKLDAQFATVGRIHATRAPLLVGNYFDTRRLSRFSGELRLDTGGDDNPYYAFEGMIDELRISNAARARFPSAEGR